MVNASHHPASFRDPAGFMYREGNILLRQVNPVYRDNYDLLIQSGLYEKLVQENLLIAHRELPVNGSDTGAYKILEPRQLPFISYAWEWSFSALQDAALLTLNVMKKALAAGMILKDATHFNVQFAESKPVFIDTLSFERYDTSLPWVAYRQFCSCFLFPLYLAKYKDAELIKLLLIYPEGIPVSLAASLLPARSRFNLGVWMHVFLQQSVSHRPEKPTASFRFDLQKMLRLLDNLYSIIAGLNPASAKNSTWSNYYSETILGNNYLEEKKNVFTGLLSGIGYTSALDAGANDGVFTEILASNGARVIAADMDTVCVDRLYRQARQTGKNILPLCIDLANPSPATGLFNQERDAFGDRAGTELVAALAILHHLVLGKNIPLGDAAKLFSDLAQKWLILEFVPIDDPKAQELIRHKTSWHLPYDEAAVENHFAEFFIPEEKIRIPGTGRILYRMRKK
jgi:hypothetical protein